ncbi:MULTISPECIES: hypothetical protein [Methylopilaceae]|uniref:Uncharacterized protein n=2 Tax=Methylopilaceae TaxID=3149309 RepID=A0A4Q0M9Q3_9HYPH|nr:MULTISPECIES: hypothetical protein [Methylocystaceae]QZO00588.1 hypothetical protein K6K41_02360 [Chenggangzhangella methanolivorans]RXF69948.1 hypothetical protein EK403_17600 [Hansschlegelia zhihuaiae]
MSDRPRDLGDVVNDIERIRHEAGRRAPGQKPVVEPFYDSRDPDAVERAAAAIEQWTDPGARRWSTPLRRYAAELRAPLAVPTEAELVRRCVTGEHDVTTLREILQLTLVETMDLLIGYRAKPRDGMH